MTKRIIIFLFAILTLLELQAQTEEKYGTSYNDAIPVAFAPGKTIFTDVRNTSQYPPYYSPCRYVPRDESTYRYTQGGAVYYRMELSNAGDVTIHNWNSRMGFSTLFLLRPTMENEIEDWSENGYSFKRVFTVESIEDIYFDKDPEELGIPPGSSRGLAYLHIRKLPAGIYYIVVAGYRNSNASKPNGVLGTTIIANLSPSIPDEPQLMPEEPNDSPIQYQYDSSGNRIKTIKKQ